MTADLERVRVRLEGKVIADHARVWARRQTVTDPLHVQAAARLRQAFQHPQQPRNDDALQRDLADYDRAFGLSLEAM